ncbi:hypothetical protein ACLRDI_21180 [Pseudomonas piscis]|uniref:hypothetical protein n=1 Tax=Pseudomonas piscis TaxID=2614538 RepID=UPI0039A457B3
MRTLIVSALLAISFGASASQPNSYAINTMYNSRVEEMMESTGMDFKGAIDAANLKRDWDANQARAQLKYSKPNMYVGRVDKILFNNGNADFVLNLGKKTQVIVTLAPYQGWPWVESKGKWSIGGVQTNLEFAANINVGDRMYFQCRRVEYVGQVYLVNCLAFPSVLEER